MSLFRRRVGWTLADAVERHAAAPDTFRIPTGEATAAVQVGDRVKLVVEPDTGLAERMWVVVTTVGEESLEGTLASDPAELRGLRAGDAVRFERRHVIAISRRPARTERRWFPRPCEPGRAEAGSHGSRLDGAARGDGRSPAASRPVAAVLDCPPCCAACRPVVRSVLDRRAAGR